MKTLAVITWCGRAIWLRRRERLLAAGAAGRCRQSAALPASVTQEAAGNWAQNLWLDGRPYWGGVQMDETAFPILLLDLPRREAAPGSGQVGALVAHGSQRREFHSAEWPGHATGSLGRRRGLFAVHAGGGHFRVPGCSRYRGINGTRRSAVTVRDAADAWNDNSNAGSMPRAAISPQRIGMEGYYVRIAPPDTDCAMPRRRKASSHQESAAARRSASAFINL